MASIAALGSALVPPTAIAIEIFKFRSTFSRSASYHWVPPWGESSRLGGARHTGSRAVTRQARSRVGEMEEGTGGRAEAEIRKAACALVGVVVLTPGFLLPIFPPTVRRLREALLRRLPLRVALCPVWRAIDLGRPGFLNDTFFPFYSSLECVIIVTVIIFIISLPCRDILRGKHSASTFVCQVSSASHAHCLSVLLVACRTSNSVC